MITPYLLEISFFIGAFSYIWVAQFLYPGKILDFGRKWIDKVTEWLPKGKSNIKGKVRFSWYECESCLSGQISLATALILWENPFVLFVLSVTIASILGGICRK